jgi:hypothetical protein
MNKLQLRQELKRIGDRNRRFNGMTPERKRVTIARDTIAALKDKKFIATHDGYLDDKSVDNGDKLPNNYKCQACALGGMFVGLTTRIKNLTVKTHGRLRSQITAPLEEFFDVDQLKAIEYAYEQGCVSQGNLDCDYAYKCESYGREYLDSSKRLIAIMQNIINNNGTFTP